MTVTYHCTLSLFTCMIILTMYTILCNCIALKFYVGIVFKRFVWLFGTYSIRQDLIQLSHVWGIKTHGCVSVAKKAVWRTSVLFTGTANSPFSAPRISITTGPISIKFTYFMPSIYATLHTIFERNRSSSSRDMCSWKLPYFLHLFLLLRTVLQK